MVAWAHILSMKRALSGFILLAAILSAASAAPLITWFPPQKTLVGEPFQPPNSRHPFGTDDTGKDIYTNLIYGARISLLVGFTAATIAATIGILVGALSGYYGGKLDGLLMRVTEMFLILPAFLLALLITAIFGQDIRNIILAIAVVSWPGAARLIRAEFLSIKQRPFIEAAKALGASDIQIIFGEILPNAIRPLIPYFILQVGTAILIEAGLGFLGASDPNLPSWGSMLNNAQRFLRTAWWMALFPGLALTLTVLSLNFIGESISDYLNPRLRVR
jgi:peptide/nickel transport system permease protein